MSDNTTPGFGDIIPADGDPFTADEPWSEMVGTITGPAAASAPVLDPPQPLTVEFEISLNTRVGTRMVRNYEGEWVGDEPQTLADGVMERLATMLFEAHKNDTRWYNNRLVDAALDRIIDARVAAVMEAPYRPTDAFGNPKGEPTSLLADLDKRITDWLHDPLKDRSGYKTGKTNLQAIIDNAVGAALTKDIVGAVGEAKAQAVAAVRASAADILAQIIANAVPVGK